MKCEKFMKKLFEKDNGTYMPPLYYLHTVFCKKCRNSATAMNNFEIKATNESRHQSNVKTDTIFENSASFIYSKKENFLFWIAAIPVISGVIFLIYHLSLIQLLFSLFNLNVKIPLFYTIGFSFVLYSTFFILFHFSLVKKLIHRLLFH